MKSSKYDLRSDLNCSLQTVPCLTTHEYLLFCIISDLDDFGVNSFEPRLIPSYPMVIPVHEPFTVKTFVPMGRPAPSYR